MQLINKTMIEYAIKIAHEVEADSLLICVDVNKDIAAVSEDMRKGIGIIVATPERHKLPVDIAKYAKILDVPAVNLTRMGKIKLAIAKGIVLGYFKRGDRIICLSGVPKFGYADSIFFIDVGKEFELLSSDFINEIIEAVQPEVFNTVLTMACELAAQGRENKKIGTMFVLGDDEKVLQLSRQMIINPFLGYSEEQRNILSPDLNETIKEFSTIDGAFIINSTGTIITAGRHLNASLANIDFPAGLGSRHIAAAAITTLTKAVAIVVSESSGNVTVFKNGKFFVTIKKPVEQ